MWAVESYLSAPLYLSSTPPHPNNGFPARENASTALLQKLCNTFTAHQRTDICRKKGKKAQFDMQIVPPIFSPSATHLSRKACIQNWVERVYFVSRLFSF